MFLNPLIIVVAILAITPIAVGIPYFLQKWCRNRTCSSVGAWALSVTKYSSVGVCLGSACGALGPLIFYPEVYQGPLIGLLILVPAGFLIGAALGSYLGINKQCNDGLDSG